MKVRITLVYVVDSYEKKKGDTLVIYNDLFNKSNGLAFWEIDRNNFDVLKVELFTGFLDIENREIYVGDNVEVDMHPKIPKNNKMQGVVTFDVGTMCIKIDETNNSQFDIGGTPCMFDFENFKIIS